MTANTWASQFIKFDLSSLKGRLQFKALAKEGSVISDEDKKCGGDSFLTKLAIFF